MKIRVTDLPPSGATIESDLSVENLNARMNEAKGNDIRFLSAPQLSLHLRPEKGGVEVRGTVDSSYAQPCSRCLEEVRTPLHSDIQLTLKPKQSRPGVDRMTTSAEWADDVGIVYFDGEHIDLEDVIQECLILSLSPFGPEHDNCLGVPKHRSDNQSEEKPTTLSDLLKRAGVN